MGRIFQQLVPTVMELRRQLVKGIIVAFSPSLLIDLHKYSKQDVELLNSLCRNLVKMITLTQAYNMFIIFKILLCTALAASLPAFAKSFKKDWCLFFSVPNQNI